MIDLLTDLFARPGYGFEAMDRALLRAAIAAQWDSGRWVMLKSPDGEFWGWMAWWRADPLGAALIRDYGMFGVMHLALAIRPGPLLAVMFLVIAPTAPFYTIAALWRLMKHANPGAAYAVGYLSTRRHETYRWFRRVL